MASHKAYNTVLGYQVSAYCWFAEQHQATAAITIKLDGHMLDARQCYTSISHLMQSSITSRRDTPALSSSYSREPPALPRP